MSKITKKLSLLLTISIISVVILFSGCNNIQKIQIDQYAWTMTTVQNKKDNGKVIAHGTDGKNTFDSAVSVKLKCKAEKSTITLTDITNNKIYAGSYEIADVNPDSVIYDVKIGNTTGIGVCALTTYNDGDSDPTFTMKLGDYNLVFFAD